MIFQRTKVATALACIAGAGGAMAVTGAFAQAQNPDVPSLTRQPAPDIRVEVTGSNSANHPSRSATVTGARSAVAMRPGIDAL